MITEKTKTKVMTLERAKALLKSEESFLCAVPCGQNYPACIVKIKDEEKKVPSVCVEKQTGASIGDRWWFKLNLVLEDVSEGCTSC